ncbi:MAG TPA: DNA internalization-related competence protein ComEC/Rec2 [Crenotrichaceae bacterium]|nr:DNA internalization-related competence protein ComEC/Rec2 [Crenotrichaceae bacterium]
MKTDSATNHSRPFLLTTRCILFVCGVCVFQLMPTLPDPRWFVFMFFLSAMLWWRKQSDPVFFLAGYCWAWLFAGWALNSRLPAELEGKTLSVSASIISIPQCHHQVCRFIADIQQLAQSQLVSSSSSRSGNTRSENTMDKRQVKLSWYYPPQDLQAGQNWLLTVRLKRPHGMMNPGGFDYEQWLFAHGIDATGYVRCKKDCRLLPETKHLNAKAISAWVQQQRHNIYLKLQNYLRNSPVAGLVVGMTVGIRDDITSRQWDILRNTGTTHLMAISGLHVGLVAGLAFWLARRTASWVGIKRWSPHQIAAITAMLCATGYAMLAGLSLPTQRALIMLGIIFGSVLLQTSLRSMHLLAITAVIVVIVNPLAVLSAGFWLSFGAVAIISLMICGRNRGYGYWHATWSVGWRVALGLSPLLLLFFGNVSLIAPVANLIAVPVVSILVVPVSLFGIVISGLSVQLAIAVFNFASLILSAVMWFLEQLSAFQFSTLSTPRPSVWAVLFGITGVLLLLLPKGVQARWLGFILLLPVFFPSIAKIDPGSAQVTVLDVGQGLSTVVETANHTLVFDTGIRLSPRFDMGSAVLLPYLRSRAIHHVDQLILSHTDSDHIGGAQILLDSLPVLQEFSSYPQHVPGKHVELCEPGKQWQWDGVDFIMLAPLLPYSPAENNNSCVIKISAGGDRVLLTGDIESRAENRLIDEYNHRLNSRVLIVPHHGSKTSSSAAFLDAVKPDLAIIAAGYRNQYGFPHRKIVKRYAKNKVSLLNTAYSGSISFVIGTQDNQHTVTEYRHQSQRYWNQR